MKLEQIPPRGDQRVIQFQRYASFAFERVFYKWIGESVPRHFFSLNVYTARARAHENQNSGIRPLFTVYLNLLLYNACFNGIIKSALYCDIAKCYYTEFKPNVLLII